MFQNLLDRLQEQIVVSPHGTVLGRGVSSLLAMTEPSAMQQEQKTQLPPGIYKEVIYF